MPGIIAVTTGMVTAKRLKLKVGLIAMRGAPKKATTLSNDRVVAFLVFTFIALNSIMNVTATPVLSAKLSLLLYVLIIFILCVVLIIFL